MLEEQPVLQGLAQEPVQPGLGRPAWGAWSRRAELGAARLVEMVPRVAARGSPVVPHVGVRRTPGGLGGAGRTAPREPGDPAEDMVGSPIGGTVGLGNSSKKVKSAAVGGEVCSAKGKVDSSKTT